MFPAFILILATTEESGLKSSVSWQLDWAQFSQCLLHRTRKNARGRETLGENRLWLRKIFKQGKGVFFFLSSPSRTSLRVGDFKKNLEWNKYWRVAMSKGNEWESLKIFKILLQCTYLFSGYLKSTNKFCYFKIALRLDIFILTLIPVILGTIWIYIIVFHMHAE